jgi:hypothetical protein
VAPIRARGSLVSPGEDGGRRRSLMREALRNAVTFGVVAATLLAAVPIAGAADLPSHRRHRHDGRLVRGPVVVQQVVPAQSEYYERPLYEGPPFFYRPYYGSGPALQIFDFGLGREKYE